MLSRSLSYVFYLFAAQFISGVSIASRGLADTLWDHNGSTMRLVANGNQRTFIYEQPKDSLVSAGVKQGTVLFEGVRDGSSYRGTARRFSKNCEAPLIYEVVGKVENEQRVVLQGTREVFDKACRATGVFKSDTLIFTLKSENAASSRSGPLAMFSGTWSSISGNCETEEGDPEIITIATQYTTWQTYHEGSQSNVAYDWCDFGDIRHKDHRSVLVGIGCAHPGHSRPDLRIQLIDQHQLMVGDKTFFRCE